MTRNNKQNGALMRAQEVKEVLGVSDEILQRMVKENRLRRVRLTSKGHWFYYRRDVERFLVAA